MVQHIAHLNSTSALGSERQKRNPLWSTRRAPSICENKRETLFLTTSVQEILDFARITYILKWAIDSRRAAIISQWEKKAWTRTLRLHIKQCQRDVFVLKGIRGYWCHLRSIDLALVKSSRRETSKRTYRKSRNRNSPLKIWGNVALGTKWFELCDFIPTNFTGIFYNGGINGPYIGRGWGFPRGRVKTRLHT